MDNKLTKILSFEPDTRPFPGQQCQNESINKEFRKLHESLVNQVIDFCKTHDITIDEFHLNADCLEESIKHGSWNAYTDSSLAFYKMTDEEYNRIKSQQEPYLFSM